MQPRDNALLVFTEDSLEYTLDRGWTGDWRVSEESVKRADYVVLVKKETVKNMRNGIEHSEAFAIAKITGTTRDESCRPGHLNVTISDWAPVLIKNAWKAWRRPERYTSTDLLGIDPTRLEWRSLTDREPRPFDNKPHQPRDDDDDEAPSPHFTYAEFSAAVERAKAEALDLIFKRVGVPAEKIKITVEM